MSLSECLACRTPVNFLSNNHFNLKRRFGTVAFTVEYYRYGEVKIQIWRVAIANVSTDSALQLSVVAASPFTGYLHKHLCSCNISEDYGQKPRRVSCCMRRGTTYKS